MELTQHTAMRLSRPPWVGERGRPTPIQWGHTDRRTEARDERSRGLGETRKGYPRKEMKMHKNICWQLLAVIGTTGTPCGTTSPPVYRVP